MRFSGKQLEDATQAAMKAMEQYGHYNNDRDDDERIAQEVMVAILVALDLIDPIFVP